MAIPNIIFWFFLFLQFIPRTNEWHIMSLEFGAEHVSLDSPRLILKPRPQIWGPKVVGVAWWPLWRRWAKTGLWHWIWGEWKCPTRGKPGTPNKFT